MIKHNPKKLTNKAIPVQPGERIAFVDILRGFAVFGILVANMSGYSGHTIYIDSLAAGIDRTLIILIRFLIVAKFYSLFSFLFGWGMAIQMERATGKGVNFLPVYVRRLLILLIFGIIHGVLIWNGDILTLYAMLGLVLLLFRNRSPRFLLIALVLCLFTSILLTAPSEPIESFRAWYEEITSFLRTTNLPENLYATGSYLQITQLRLQGYLNGLSRSLYSFGNVFAMFLLGLYVGKRRIFQDIDHHITLVWKTLIIGLVIGAIFHGLWVWSSINPGWLPFDWVPIEYSRMIQRVYYTIGAPAIMLFYVSALILLSRRKSNYNQLAPLGNVGRAALSNYLFQSIIATLIFYNYGLGLYGQISPAFGLLLTIIIFLTQIKLSAWWFERHKFGPAERIWRILTYLKWRPSTALNGNRDRNIGKKYHSIIRIYTKIGPYPLLIFSWLVLISWGVILINWHNELENSNNQSLTQFLTFYSPAKVRSISSTLAENEQIKNKNSNVVSIPKVKPITYTPSQLAASGDVLALAETFDLDRTLNEIRVLSADQFEGRASGSPGSQAVGNYIADQFAASGLRPLDVDGTYFQPFNITYTPVTNIPTLSVQTPDGKLYDKYSLYEDFSPIIKWYSGSGFGSANAYWLTNCSDEDFAGIDVVGKVLLCNPGDESNWLAEMSRNALEHGAIALLLVADPTNRPPDIGGTIKEIWVPEPIPTFWIYPEVVQDILSGSPLKPDDLVTSEKPYPLEAKVFFDIQTAETSTCPGKGCTARNILGILPGRDPNYSNEALILGAHYDHLGKGPDGTIWSGANDNASGVAVLLEIARRWHEYGYVPRRTVIFAAWDAEEMGLVGSEYYVNNPLYPLSETIAMIQLDMIGAGGETLSIDGEQNLSKQISLAAESYEINSEYTSMGRSDHVPFISAGVPASLIIWRNNESAVPHYHRPIDTISIINPDTLEAAAQIAELSTLNIVESEPAIMNMLGERATAAINGDSLAFLETSQYDQRQIDQRWFADFQSLNPVEFDLSARDLLITGNEATAKVDYVITYHSLESETITETLNTQLSTRFEHGRSGWVWSGPNLVTDVEENTGDRSDTQFITSLPPDLNTDLSNLNQIASDRYIQIANLLGLPAEVNAKLLLLPDHKSLRTSTSLLLPESQTMLVSSGEIRLVYSEQITSSVQLDDAVAKLILAESGVSETNAPWLWSGLPLLIREIDDSALIQSRFIPDLQDMLNSDEMEFNSASAWAATKYIKERIGWSGLGDLIKDIGEGCSQGRCRSDDGINEALNKHLELDFKDFNLEWQQSWRARLESAQSEIDAVISSRANAIAFNNQAAFLSSVNRNTPNLLQEQAKWFSDLDPNIKDTLSISARPMALLSEGNILAKVSYTYQPEGLSSTNGTKTVSQKIIFSPSDGGYQWSGPMIETISGQQIIINYPHKSQAFAGDLLHLAENFYSSIASSLAISNTEPIYITLFDSHEDFNSSIGLSWADNDRITSWTGFNEGIKLKIAANQDVDDHLSALVDQLIRNTLQNTGVDREWLLGGLSAYLSRRYDGGVLQKSLATQLPTIQDKSNTIFLNSVIPIYDQNDEEALFSQTVAWDAVKYLIETYGWDAVENFLQKQDDGNSFASAFMSTFGIDLNAFELQWRQSLSNGHILQTTMPIAKNFNQNNAMEHVKILTGPDMAGRKAGSQGALQAANYIAGNFEDYGLKPLLDQIFFEEDSSIHSTDQNVPSNQVSILSETIAISPSLTSYFQTFPISYTEDIPSPRLAFHSPETSSTGEYTYLADFMAVKPTIGQPGPTSGDLVWIGDHDYFEADIGGKVALLIPVNEPEVEIEQLASKGAAGIIFIGNKRKDAEIMVKHPNELKPDQGANIPVIEFTQTGYTKLLEALGYNRLTIRDLPVGSSLNLTAQLDYNIGKPDTVLTSNVLGYIPGSDPQLKQEFIIIGAHYDHVGDDPGGLRFSGANDNASGIGVILEIARSWQESGYKPKRSILFAAWGAQELGQVGSQYFIQNPPVPIESIIGMIQLDGVGGGEGFNLGVNGTWEDNGYLMFVLSTAGSSLEEKLVYTESNVSSDDESFRSAGIPATLIAWRLANEDNLPDPIAQAVHPSRLGETGRIISLTLMNLGR